MDSGVSQLPAEAIASVKQLVHNLCTWEGFLLIVAVTALFVLGGEIALLLMGAVAVYDPLMNVLPLLVQFYHAAIAATTPEQIRAAGKIFAQALLRGRWTWSISSLRLGSTAVFLFWAGASSPSGR